ncbi:hypothetical protein ACP70R_050048 [Stipagrostis hirtigluma subsp. patula]
MEVEAGWKTMATELASIASEEGMEGEGNWRTMVPTGIKGKWRRVSHHDWARPLEELIEEEVAMEELRRRLGKGIKRPHDDAEEETQPGRTKRARVSMERIFKLRAFARTTFRPIPDRYLRRPFFDEAEVEEMREGMRLTAELHAEIQGLARDALEEHEAKGFLECNADGTIRVSGRPETLHDE